MELLLTPSSIMFILGIFGVVFGIYRYFRDPQVKLEKSEALDELATKKDKELSDKDLGTKATILAQKEVENKSNILAQQFQWEKEANEKKFAEFGLRLDASIVLAQNHIHTIDVKVDGLMATVGTMSNKITELATIINERIPRKIE